MAASFWKTRAEESWKGLSRWVTVSTLQRVLGRPAPGSPVYIPEARLLYVAASALPYHISGYATRTHEILRALQAVGTDLMAMTRPGYPWDRRDRHQDASGHCTQVEGLVYHHVDRPNNYRWPVLGFSWRASGHVMRLARGHRVARIHAASNHVNALPALLAARRLGVPFQYEMRGLWELTRISRMPDYEHTQAFRQGLQLESLVARHADRLFVISEQLGRYVVEQWGVDPARLALLPNCVDPDRFVPADPADVQPCTLGYAGSLIGYEGLDTLIDAVHRLKTQGYPVLLNVIGDGEARAALQAQTWRLGLGDRVRFLGKVPPDQARQHLASCALVCIPRKPYQVCRIVPPIKLVEAMAMGKPVIVPDLPVFRDELGADPAGWFFRAGDDGDLAQVVQQALTDPERLAAMGRAARHHAIARRNWKDYVPQLMQSVAGEGTSCWAY